jgi:hypothetical protein
MFCCARVASASLMRQKRWDLQGAAVPIDYTISPSEKLVLVNATGIVARDDMDRLRARLLSDGRLQPGMSMILEAKLVDSRLTFTDLQDIAGRLSGIFERGIGKVAVVVDSRYAYSLAKTFSVFAANEPVRMKPFRDREDAERWLTSNGTEVEEQPGEEMEPQSIVERDDSLIEVLRRNTPRSNKRIPS